MTRAGERGRWSDGIVFQRSHATLTVQAAYPPNWEPQSQTMNATVGALLQNRRVLLVDDESMVLMLVEDMLIELGAAVVETAMALDEAARMAATAPLDVAVLDVNLSGQTSYPVAELLKARRIPFLFATGYGSAGHEKAWRETPTVAKPFAVQDLARALRLVLANADGREGSRDKPAI